MVVRICIDFFEEGQCFGHIFFLSAGQEEDVSLHAIDIDPWNDLNVGVGSLGSFKVFVTIMLACFQFHGLVILGKMLFFEVVVAGYKVVKFLHVLDGKLNA